MKHLLITTLFAASLSAGSAIAEEPDAQPEPAPEVTASEEEDGIDSVEVAGESTEILPIEEDTPPEINMDRDMQSDHGFDLPNEDEIDPE